MTDYAINNRPLCIDCDGTLIHTDLLLEGALKLIKKKPWLLALLPLWLIKGKAYLKRRIADQVEFNWALLPYCQEIIALSKSAIASGRKVVLVSASPAPWVEGIAQHTGLFHDTMSTRAINLAGSSKAKALVDAYGDKGYDYAGNSNADIPVWKHAHNGFIVSDNQRLIAKAKTYTEISDIYAPPKATALAYLKAIRVHQWLKNLLVLVPLFAAHQVLNPQTLATVVLAFFAFSFCASSVYVLNDLLDLEADREHIRKRNRPFASGVIPVQNGTLLAPILLVAAAGVCVWLPSSFGVVLTFYFFLTLLYSFWLKKQVIVDVMLLASLYTLRIIAGAAAANIVPSFWLLAFSMFIFLSLAIVKRYSELSISLKKNKKKAAGRGYIIEDLPVLSSLGAASGMASVLVLALYINDQETLKLYPKNLWLWLAPPILLYWVSRLWIKTCRDEVDDDPVVFAVKDWQSLLMCILLFICFYLSSTNL